MCSEICRGQVEVAFGTSKRTLFTVLSASILLSIVPIPHVINLPHSLDFEIRNYSSPPHLPNIYQTSELDGRFFF